MLSKKKPEPIATNFGTVKLTKGLVTIVDARDIDWINRWKWKARKSANTVYAVRDVIVNGKSHQVKLHREIIACPKNLVVHHKNHKSLDNRRCNLENVTPAYHRHIHRCNW